MFQVNLDYTTQLELNKETSCYVYEMSEHNNYDGTELTSLSPGNIQETTLSANCDELNMKASEPITDNKANNKVGIQQNGSRINYQPNIITTQPKRNNHYKNSDQQADVMTFQPSNNLPKNIKDYTFLGILKNDSCRPCVNKNIAFVDLSKQHLAFKQKLLCCHPILSYNCSCKNPSLFPTNQLTLINTDSYNEASFIKKINLPVKEISVDERNNSFIILYDDDNLYKSSSELYLVKQGKVLDLSTPIKKINFEDEVKIECPVEKINSIYYSNDYLYVIARRNDRLILLFTSIDTTGKNQNNYWKEITTLSSDNFNGNAKFSSNSAFIFLLSTNKQLLVFSKNEGWTQTNKITNIASFPVNINYNSGRMIFIDNNKLLVKSLTSDITYTFISNGITAACFIPNTKNFLMFSSEPKMYLIKQSATNENKYNTVAQETIKHIIRKAYFHPQDYSKLIVLADKYHPENDICLRFIFTVAPIPSGVGFTCCGTCIKYVCCTGNPCRNCCDTPDCYCCSSELCGKYKFNSQIGAYWGAGISALICMLSCIDCILYANTSQTKLLDIKDREE